MQTRRPEPGPALHQGLFVKSRDPIAAVAEGIGYLIRNARRLYEDAKVLSEANRPVSAEFLLATAKEEVGKVFLLLDMIKLDFAKHESILRRLCRAFYNHGVKSAYTTLNTEYKLADLREAKEAFSDAKAPWVLGEEEDGVPDMPSLWVIEREWRLYVDYIAEDSKWLIPEEFDKDSWVTKVDLDNVENCIQRAEEANEKGNFELKCLRSYHKAFSKHFFNDRSDERELVKVSLDFLDIPYPKETRYWQLQVACPPKIGPSLMRDSCKITTGGNISENKKVFGGAGISDSPGGRFRQTGG